MTRSSGFKWLATLEPDRTLHQELNRLRTAGVGKPRKEPNQFIRSHDNGLNRTVSGAVGVSSSGVDLQTNQENEQ